MTLPDLDPSRSAEQLFGDILAYVEKADAMVSARDPVMLAGLDTAVEALCKRMLELTPVQGKEYKPELEHLVARIDALKENMMKLQGEIATTMKSLGSQRKASMAYQNAPNGKVED